MKPPKVESSAQKEINKAQEQFDSFHEGVKELSKDCVPSSAPESEPAQAKKKSDVLYLKPERSFPPFPNREGKMTEKFNENFRKDWEYLKEYIEFIAENVEVSGELIESWTKPLPGVDCEFWLVPSNRLVAGPRYLYNQIRSRCYRQLFMDEVKVNGPLGFGAPFQELVKEKIVSRMKADQATDRHFSFYKPTVNF